ncbi:MAG: PAS domain S-box protein [Mariprofundaceae bacterium]|nr:PAS domain S-box protein [Mariprofundaceae bacterium]
MMLLQYHKHMIYLLLCLASLDALAWVLNHDAFLSWFPWFTHMTFNTAFGFICLSLAMLLFQSDKGLFHHIARFLLLGWGIFASVSLAQDIFQVNLGLDQSLLRLPQAADDSLAARMSPLTAAAFIISSLIFMHHHYFKQGRYFKIISHSLILLLSSCALQGLILNVIHIDVDHTWAHVASMSVMTSCLFFLIVCIALAYFQKANPKDSYCLYSGLYVMYRLSYPQKFMLISAVMLIPLFLFMLMKWQDLNNSIHHSQMELSGIQYIQETSKLALAMAKHRGMSHANSSDSSLFQQALRKERINIDEMFMGYQIKDKLNQGALSMLENWQDVLTMWHTIKEKKLSSEESWVLHSKIIRILNDHIHSLSRKSGLSYDENPLIHDLLIFQWMIVPELVENLGKIRGQGTRILAYKVIKQDDLMKVEMLKRQVHFYVHESDEILSHVWENQDMSAFHSMYQHFHQNINAFLAYHLHPLSSASQGDSETYFRQGTQAIESVEKFNQISMVYVQQQLSQRNQNNLTEKYWIGVTALWVILLILYLFVSFYQSVMLTIQSLQDATERMRRGEKNILSESPTQDELGDVVTSFNSIAQELLQMTDRMHAMVEHAVDGIVSIQASGDIYHVNSAAEKIFGYSKGELLGRNVTCLMPERFRKQHQDGLQHYLKTGNQTVFGCILELEGLRKNQEAFPMTLSINEMKLDDERMFVAMVRDISGYKKLEQQLRQSEKMEAIGELVAGVAHNFNNMLAAIQGKAYLARTHLEKTQGQASHYLEDIENSVNQAAAMVQQLLIFSKKDFLKRKCNLSLNHLIQDVYAKSILGIPNDVSVSLHLLDDEMMVYADREQLEQGILHLLNNALDAVAESNVKQIEIRLSLPKLEQSFYQRHNHLKHIRYVCLTVSDTGHGMSEKIQSRIFDPFYSTKEVGKGTGLGLSSLMGSVESHEGVVEVESEPLLGSSFHVYLPLIEVATSRLQETHLDAVIAEKQQGMLLFVDDDAMVIEAHQEIFEDLGYQVLVASDGQEGLDRFEKHQMDVLAVITNVVMPKMGGVEMMQKIHQISPDLPVVYITGYGKGDVKLTKDEQAYSCILSKPIDIEHLSKIIHEYLASNMQA